MLESVRRHASLLVAALALGALAANTVVAQAPTPEPGLSAAESGTRAADPAITIAGLNADTVDGRHAIKATAKKKARRNKLVATDRQGFLPSNIVKPKWNLIQGKPAGFADGYDDVGYVEYVQGPYECPPGACGLSVRYIRDLDVHFTLLPLDANRPLTAYEYSTEWIPMGDSGLMEHGVRFRNQTAWTVNYEVRVTVFAHGMARPALMRQLKSAEVRVLPRR